MIWWQWDKRNKSWRPTAIPLDAPIHVSDNAQLIPLAGTRHCALLAGRGVRLNGLPCLPLEILNDRDEISVDGEIYYFSRQSPPDVVTFLDDKKKVRCARCLGQLAGGDQVVRCPACRAHHHSTCWACSARCQKCPFPTDGTVWVPDSLN